MAQHDQVIDNGPGLTVRTDINAAIAALFSSSSGPVEPSVKVAGQLWFNTTTGKLSMRNTGNTAWVGVASEIDGTVTIGTTNNWAEFSGTSPNVSTALISVRDARTTTGAAGNAVFAIKRQGSSTASLMLGNDGNGAALIGGNNIPMRFGKWVSGVFTEYMNLAATGVLTFSGPAQQVILGGAGGGIEIAGSSPSIKFTDTTASAYDFWCHVDAQNFYVLVDRTGEGTYETPHPLTLEADTNKGYLFGTEIVTTAVLAAAGYVPASRTITAGAGLTGGGDLSANRSVAMGTPGTLTATTTNSATGTTHYHLIDEDSIVSAGMAALGLGSIGTYALMRSQVGSIAAGATVAGSSLRYSTADGGETSATVPPGTWRCMGYCELITTFLRIS